jgi:hypothetical protein
MGTWGTDIFSDDLACDVRDEYRDLVANGLSGEQATQALIAEWAEALADPETSPVFWLALAATQWRCGRLEPQVLERALEIIDSGADLSRWEDSPQLVNKRKAVLDKLRETLLSPQPPSKRLRKRFRNTCEWEIGEVIAYRLVTGDFILFRVIGYHVDKGGTSPVFEILDWTGPIIPDADSISKLRVKTWSRSWPADVHQLMVGRVSQRELPVARVTRLGIKLQPVQKHVMNYNATLWRWLDRSLEVIFGSQPGQSR